MPLVALTPVCRYAIATQLLRGLLLRDTLQGRKRPAFQQRRIGGSVSRAVSRRMHHNDDDVGAADRAPRIEYDVS
jgi:hypothetical protein